MNGKPQANKAMITVDLATPFNIFFFLLFFLRRAILVNRSVTRFGRYQIGETRHRELASGLGQPTKANSPTLRGAEWLPTLALFLLSKRQFPAWPLTLAHQNTTELQRTDAKALMFRGETVNLSISLARILIVGGTSSKRLR